jgi:hypothetical protein
MNAVLLEDWPDVALKSEGARCARVNGGYGCGEGAAVVSAGEGGAQQESGEDGVYAVASHGEWGGNGSWSGGTREYAVYELRVKRPVDGLLIKRLAAPL